jgi:hypothetical protein
MTSRAPLALRATIQILIFFAALALLLFGGARTLHYPEAWAFLTLVFMMAVAITLYLFLFDPALLERRMRSGETEPTQKRVIAWGYVACTGIFAVPGFDHYYQWSAVPSTLKMVSFLFIGAAYVALFWVLRHNSFASRGIHRTGEIPVPTGNLVTAPLKSPKPVVPVPPFCYSNRVQNSPVRLLLGRHP